MGVADITAHAGINHNSVRQHLAKLCAADLVIEEVVRSGGPGRPALRYRPAPGSAALSGATSPYEHLAVLLLEVLEGGTPAEVGAAAGRRAIPAVTGDVDPLEVLEAEMTRQGFRSHREETDTRVDLVVSHCPFAAAATAYADIVCELHRGMTQGMVDALGGMLHIGLVRPRPPDRRVPHPAGTAGCWTSLGVSFRVAHEHLQCNAAEGAGEGSASSTPWVGAPGYPTAAGTYRVEEPGLPGISR